MANTIDLYEMLKDFLSDEGFKYTEEDFGLAFRYNELHFLFIKDEQDDQLFRLLLPGIYEKTEENELEVLRACNDVTYGIKVVKVFVTQNNSVSCSFEILADSTPVLNDFVPRAVRMLTLARDQFYNIIEQNN